MVRQAKTYGHSTRMVTNGTLLNGAVAKELVEAGLDRITISFWATTPEQAEKVYLRTGAETFASQLAGLDNLAEAKRRSGKKHPLVSLHQPLSKYSVDGAEQLVDLAREHGAQRVTFSPLRTKGGRLTDHAPDYEQMKSLNALRARLQSDAMGEGIDEFLLRLEIGEQVWLRMPCYVGWHHLRVDLAGRVFSCKMCRTPIGDLTMSSLREIWNGEPLQKFRRQTRTRRRLAAFRQDCECEHCCHAVTNHRMQQVLRWIDPRSRF